MSVVTCLLFFIGFFLVFLGNRQIKRGVRENRRVKEAIGGRLVLLGVLCPIVAFRMILPLQIPLELGSLLCIIVGFVISRLVLETIYAEVEIETGDISIIIEKIREEREKT